MPGGTLTCPVAGSSTGTLVLPAGALASGTAGVVTLNVALPVAPRVGGVMPLTLSLAKTLPALVLPVAPFGTLKLSGAATMGAAPTVTVMVAGSQLVGLAVSHSLYAMV